MTAPLHQEVTIIGTGPAGITAATILAQAGIPVALLGPVAGDSMKVGESLPGAAMRMFHRLGISSIDTLLSADEYLPSTANQSAWGTEDWAYHDAILDPEGGGWHLLRHRFEAALLNYALEQGVNFIEGTGKELQSNGSHYRINGHGPSGDIPIQSRWLIDASGRKSWLIRHLVGNPIRHSEQFAAVAWLEDQQTFQDNTTRIKSVEYGWWYCARLPQQLGVIAFHALPADIGKLVKDPKQFTQLCNASRILDSEIDSQTVLVDLIACDASVYTASQFAGPGWIAVGDAALAFDPLSSQGMYFAMYSGIKAAETILQCHAKPTQTAGHLDRYVQKVMAVFNANQRSRWLYYQSEPRYAQKEYWRRQMNSSKDKIRSELSFDKERNSTL